MAQTGTLCWYSFIFLLYIWHWDTHVHSKDCLICILVFCGLLNSVCGSVFGKNPHILKYASSVQIGWISVEWAEVNLEGDNKLTVMYSQWPQQNKRYCLFSSMTSSFLSKPVAYITHNSIWPQIFGCVMVIACNIASSRDEVKLKKSGHLTIYFQTTPVFAMNPTCVHLSDFAQLSLEP